MRKSQKQQAEDLISLLSQDHNEIRKAIETKKDSIVRSLLAHCQETALALGMLIEKSEGEGCCTVSLLEDYCEQIYRMYEEFIQGDGNSGKKLYKIIQKQLIKISCVIRDIPLRREVVFVPYKASMWDSLDSVWKAADAAPGCDAYVVPIPYYDKNPDGSFREMHYEGNLYPKGVPVISYKDYDFERRQPDVIFFHNPYDECNYVTSVDPFFYTNNLKKYTEKLVYVPYFILREINPNDKKAVERIAHFVTVPGVMNADKVIVQSNAMRQVYINVMTQFVGKHTRKIWEEKILGLGSPKFDKVVDTQIEDENIPAAWKQIIYKPDGNRKKVILYNTSVNAMLQYNEKMLEKMRDVFEIFKENREDVALLWRPHPLIQATVNSMRPQLWRGYIKVVEEYRGAGWGIYDDTAELDRAIALSDGYYGDASSLVELCRKVGIPVMLQNVEMVCDRV